MKGGEGMDWASKLNESIDPSIKIFLQQQRAPNLCWSIQPLFWLQNVLEKKRELWSKGLCPRFQERKVHFSPEV